LYEDDPDDPKRLLEVSYGKMNLLLLRIKSGQTADRALLEATDEAVSLAYQTLGALPDDPEALSHYANTLAWAADAERLACNLQTALDYRKATLRMATEASRAKLANNNLRLRLAFAHSGVAMVQTDLGESSEAEFHRRTALEILVDLLARDPSNTVLASEVAANRMLLADLLMNTQRLEEAVSLMQQVSQHFEPAQTIPDLTEFELNDYADFTLDSVDYLMLTGDRLQARNVLSRASEIILHQVASGTTSGEVRNRAARFRYMWFELHGEDPADTHPVFKELEPQSAGEYRNCHDTDLATRLAVVEGEWEQARNQVAYLESRHYRHPAFLRFCRQNQLCDG